MPSIKGTVYAYQTINLLGTSTVKEGSYLDSPISVNVLGSATVESGATIGARQINFRGTAKNYGTLTRPWYYYEWSQPVATFYDRSENHGLVVGAAKFLDESADVGTVQGFVEYVPPLNARWQLSTFASGEPWQYRQVYARPADNPGRRMLNTVWSVYPNGMPRNQACPELVPRGEGETLGCEKDPETYTAEGYAGFSFIIIGTGDAQEVGPEMYYKPAGFADWGNIRNWTQDPTSSIFRQSPTFPGPETNVFIQGAVTTNSTSTPTVANLNVSNIGMSREFAITVNIAEGGIAKFSGSAFLTGTINGNAEFSNGAYIAPGGQVTGNAIFRDQARNRGYVGGTATFEPYTLACNDPSTGSASAYDPYPPPDCPD